MQEQKYFTDAEAKELIGKFVEVKKIFSCESLVKGKMIGSWAEKGMKGKFLDLNVIKTGDSLCKSVCGKKMGIRIR